MKTILVVGLPGVGKTTLLERWQAQPDLPLTRFTVEQPERIFVERDLVLNYDGSYAPSGLNYEAGLHQRLLPATNGSRVVELNQWSDLISTVEAISASGQATKPQVGIPTVVVVVDAPSLLKLARQFVALTDENSNREGRAVHAAMRALLEGVFLADWVVLNKCDVISDENKDRAEQLIHHFHPGVAVIKTQFADVPWQKIWASTPTIQDRSDACRKSEEFQRANPSQAGDPSLTDFFYRARRPFHPQRFESFLRKVLQPGICLRGYFWLATRMDWAGYILGTSSSVKLHGLGHWLVSQPKSEWSQALSDDSRREAIWDQTWGDRRQEIWITAFPPFFEGLREQLDAALLDDEEMAAAPETWRAMADPFPAWRFEIPHHDHSACCGHDHDHDEHGHCCEHAHDHAEPTMDAAH